MNMLVSRSPAMSGGLRTGADYIDAIRADGRTVYYNGEVVRDVTRHPAFRGPLPRSRRCTIWPRTPTTGNA